MEKKEKQKNLIIEIMKEDEKDDLYENKLDWSKFCDFFHPSWHSVMKKWIESPECWEIYQFLKSQPRGSVIPKSNLVWEAFKHTDRNNLKVLIIGMCPYHTRIGMNDVADGLAFSTKSDKTPPSLEILKNAIKDDIGEGDIPNDLTYLSQQGVMLMNAGLTTSVNKAGNQIAIWQPFWEWFFKEVLSTQAGLIIVYMGKEAAKLERYSTPFLHYNFVLSHPSYYARIQQPMEHNNVFTKINKLLKENNGQEAQINWVESDCPF